MRDAMSPYETTRRTAPARKASGARSAGPARYRIQAIERATRVLDCFDFDKPELSVRDVAAGAGLHKSTAHRILMALQYNGLVAQDPETGCYHLAIKLFKLGQQAVARLKLREVAKPFLRRLMEESKETAYLAVLDTDRVIYLDRVEGPHALGMPFRPGRCVAMHCTSLGKALLSCLSDAEVRQVVPAEPFVRHTAKTLRNVEALVEELQTVRRRGWALVDEEAEVGLRCVGAPVRDYSGTLVAAISISGPSTRMKQSALPALGALVKKTAETISAQLGHERSVAGKQRAG
jgi:IclR family transcriptional regulator, KDG regulon repressor